jgi:hypothetical protein
MTEPDEMGDLVASLEQAAVRADGKGQLNISKLLRASATALVRRAAAARGYPDESELLAADLADLANRLKGTGIDPAFSERLQLGAKLVARGQQSYIDEFPDPYVCRRCGAIEANNPVSSCDTCGAHELTFERFRPVYWMTVYRPHEVMERLAGNPPLFQEAIDRMPDDRLEWTPAETAWAAVDVLRHVRDAQSVLAQRIVLILDEDDPPLEFQAVFEWTNQGTGRAESAHSILDAYIASRDASLSRLQAMEPDGWSRTGVHEEFGRVTLIEEASYFAAHELIHLRQLEQLRRAIASSED